MPESEPFTQVDIRARSTLAPTDGRQLDRQLEKLAKLGDASAPIERKEKFKQELRAIIDDYRRSTLADQQERPAAKIAAMQKLCRSMEKFHSDTRLTPHSVLMVAGIGNLPIEDAIANLKAAIGEEQQRVVSHRQKAITPALKEFARVLQIIAASFAPRLRSDAAKLEHWLEEALIVAGVEIPNKNLKRKFFEELKLPRKPKRNAGYGLRQHGKRQDRVARSRAREAEEKDWRAKFEHLTDVKL